MLFKLKLEAKFFLLLDLAIKCSGHSSRVKYIKKYFKKLLNSVITWCDPFKR